MIDSYLEIDEKLAFERYEDDGECVMDINSKSIKIYDPLELSYQHFLSKHMILNTPCIVSRVTQNWNIFNWVESGKPNVKHLESTYGDALVSIADCGVKLYNAQKKEELALKEYLSYWTNYAKNEYSKSYPCLYLKDWHFTRDYPEHNIYRVPKYFASDWLNEYYTARVDLHDDFRFVYMGPKGSWTPFHTDVFSSFSWSVNICGKKRWILFPPGEENCLTDKLGNLVYDVESPNLNNHEEYPLYNEVTNRLEIIQNAGDAIFVPSGWHHQVWNLEDTISINHNWVNGCNISKMWTSIIKNLDSVKSEISDCRGMEDWEEHCQVVLNATFGLDYKELCKFLLFIMKSRLKHLSENAQLKMYGDWYFGKNHLLFDLIQAKNIILQMISNPDFVQLNYFLENEHNIRSTINESDNILLRK